ncbi:MAG TPA: hypothetical protein VMT50_06455 [Steroidobacteraceae bacterium]|nr:hypothetical protein [Steroidobacteraceae bacterium]
MPLRPAYLATCDAAGCREVMHLPHSSTRACWTQLVSLGWKKLRWRMARSGIVNTKHGRVRRTDVGGGVRHLVLCPEHRGYRPAIGKPP